MIEELKKKYKINKFYKYAEHKVGDRIEFGWILTDDIEMPAVVSYSSKSQSITLEEAEWSEKEGVNASSLSDYRKYFEALVGISSEDFLDEWKDSQSEFIDHWINLKSTNTKDQAKFIIALSRLIVENKKFSMFGRIYKVIENEK